MEGCVNVATDGPRGAYTRQAWLWSLLALRVESLRCFRARAHATDHPGTLPALQHDLHPRRQCLEESLQIVARLDDDQRCWLPPNVGEQASSFLRTVNLYRMSGEIEADGIPAMRVTSDGKRR